jgi:predicted component of viral defense system (DUF524 family)
MNEPTVTIKSNSVIQDIHDRLNKKSKELRNALYILQSDENQKSTTQEVTKMNTLEKHTNLVNIYQALFSYRESEVTMNVSQAVELKKILQPTR